VRSLPPSSSLCPFSAQKGGGGKGGGSVSVSGYTRSNGTHVSGYTRSAHLSRKRLQLTTRNLSATSFCVATSHVSRMWCERERSRTHVVKSGQEKSDVSLCQGARRVDVDGGNS